MIPAAWRALALHPPRACGAPVARGRLRAAAEDFVVDEELGFEPSGAGAHVLLRVRKQDANTEWVARSLAREAGCAPRDVGYAGLKDRRAVATQWFTVPAARRPPEQWRDLAGCGYQVLEAHAHARKLPRGALASNRFEICIRELEGDLQAIGRQLERIAADGVPNYFGPQRFGREAGNLEVLAGAGRACARSQRSYQLSAARSLIFNAVLAERVAAGSWNRLCAGDFAILDGRGSVFAVAAPDPLLEERARRLEVHPTGPLWGRGPPATTGAVGLHELAVAGQLPEAREAVERAGMQQERRALRLAVRELTWTAEPAALRLAFRLAKGSFATAVLAELLEDTADG